MTTTQNKKVQECKLNLCVEDSLVTLLARKPNMEMKNLFIY